MSYTYYDCSRFEVGERIMDIIIDERKNKVVFQENCDLYFTEEHTKEEAIQILQEAIKFIEDKTKPKEQHGI